MEQSLNFKRYPTAKLKPSSAEFFWKAKQKNVLENKRKKF